MTAEQRKEKNESYLVELGIPINKWLPIVDEEHEAVIRKPIEIAKRILILAYLGVYSEDEDSEEIIEFFKTEDLWDSVSKGEKDLLLIGKLTEQEKINISWRSEAMVVLLWVINKIDKLDLPIEQCNVGELLDKLSEPFGSTKEFVQNSSIRSVEEILNQTDLFYRIHWAVRDSQLKGLEIPLGIDPGIIEEWHYAINWVTFYGEDWDDISTDT